MLHAILVWVTVAAFAGAGVDNALGRASTKADFVKWGYPAWWCYVTGALEFATAGLIAFAPLRVAGLILGSLIIAAASLTALRNRVWSDVAPLAFFIALLALVAFLR